MTANDASKRDDWELFSAIRKEELAAAIEGGRVQVVNVLEAPSKGRLRLIAHSRHIPLSELEDRLGELDRGRDVVVYCANRECPASLKAARLLAERGFHVRAYEGGIEEWVAAGLPTDAEAKKLPRTEPPAVDEPPSTLKTPSAEPTAADTSASPEQAGKQQQVEPEQERRADAPPSGPAKLVDAPDQSRADTRSRPDEADDAAPRASASQDASTPEDVPGEPSEREPATSFLDRVAASPASER